MAIAKSGAEKVGEPAVRGALRGFARMLACARALGTRLLAFSATSLAVMFRRWRRWLAEHFQAALRPDAMAGHGDDDTIVDPTPAWRTEVDPSANAAAFNGTTTRTSRVGSQELFERIMREIARSPARLDARTRRLRASLNLGTTARGDAGAAGSPGHGPTA